MKIKFILFVFIFIGFYTSDKNSTSGEVTYSFKPNESSLENRKKNKEFYKTFDYLNKAAKDLTFSLTFNESESFFEVNKKMDSDLENRVLSYAENIITKGKYYYNKNEDCLYTESKIYDEYTLIKTKPSEVSWKITKETKKIDGFNCFKAKTIKTKSNNIRDIKIDIEAWFTPDIPVSYGPLEFNNLPGLILEVKAANFTFYANKIELNDKSKLIKKLESKNIITLKEHKKNLKKLQRLN